MPFIKVTTQYGFKNMNIGEAAASLKDVINYVMVASNKSVKACVVVSDLIG